MYAWLHDEINLIKTKRFHVTHLPPFYPPKPVVPKTTLPPSHLLFLAEFGHSKLYRNGRRYKLHIFDAPYIEEWGKDDYVRFGTLGALTRLCFKREFMSSGAETPIFELDYIDGEIYAEQTHLRFDKWLFDNSAEFKEEVGTSRWREIVDGPPPFTEYEQRIVEARRQYIYKIVGFTDSGDAEILVENRSQLVLPYLTIGVAAEQPIGAVWLPVRDLMPGESRVISANLYKKTISQKDVRLSPLPDPEPEDRETYGEFKS